MITKEQAQSLGYGDTLEHVRLKNSDGSPRRCRVNGQLKVWKTRPNEFKLPVKHGLYTCFYITQDNANEWTVAAPCQVGIRRLEGVNGKGLTGCAPEKV